MTHSHRCGALTVALALAGAALPPASLAQTAAVPAAPGTATPTPAATPAPEGQRAASTRPGAVAAAAPDTRELTLTQLGLDYAIRLQGVSATVGIPFSVRADELVTSASLKLNYAYSPALIPELSHLRISVNDVIVTTLPVSRAEAGKPQTADIPIDRRLVTDFNRINIELVGHYTRECEDPAHSSLWATVDASSSLRLNVAPIRVTADLATLPLPFFDRRDVRRAVVPFVLGGASAPATLNAAGIVSSWFGALAGYRGAIFPVFRDEVPAGHAVVFATPETPVAGLTLPPVQGPTVTVIDHPRDPRYKLLLVLGRTAAELKTAASSLALNSRALTGTSATITAFQEPAARKPHDAPHWIASDRPVKLGELAPAGDFSVSGYTPNVVKVNLQLPPDLFNWRSRGIPLDLRYRYTPRVRPDQSTLNLNVNDSFIGSLPLRAANRKDDPWWNRLATDWLPDGSLSQRKEVMLPSLVMGSRSQLRLHYYFQPPAGNCQTLLENVSGAIDPASTIDVSDFPHYIAMPELAAYANSGFPFTRLADLADTAVVLPDNAARNDIETYLGLMGQIGHATGYPALRVSVGSASGIDQWADKDLLVIGSLENQPLFTRWAAQMPLQRAPAGGQQFRLGHWIENTLTLIEGSRQREDLPSSASDMTVIDNGTDAILAGFESPLQRGRSVVAVVSNAATQPALLDALMTPGRLKQIQGSMSIVRGAQVSSLLSGETYFVGQLPWFARLQWILSRSPLLLAAMVLLVALLGAAASYASLQLRARKRLQVGADPQP